MKYGTYTIMFWPVAWWPLLQAFGVTYSCMIMMACFALQWRCSFLTYYIYYTGLTCTEVADCQLNFGLVYSRIGPMARCRRAMSWCCPWWFVDPEHLYILTRIPLYNHSYSDSNSQYSIRKFCLLTASIHIFHLIIFFTI